MGATPTFQNLDASMGVSLPPEVETRLYQSMYRIRHAEESLAELYKEREMRTPTHFGIGQEAVAVGVCEALEKDDVVYSHHRCHTHYLAKGGSLLGLVAELYGREAGCSRGRGGSVHLTDRSVGFIGSSPILGQSVALATGSALAFRMDGSRNVAVAFFGEAVCEEGVVYEALNYASVNRLPVLYVCENNFYSTESPLAMRQPAGTELCERVRSFKVETRKVDGNDAVAMYQAARQALDRVRAGHGPFFLECETYRWREHVGPMYDHDLNRSYRAKEEVDFWQRRCPVQRAEKRLVHKRLASADRIDEWKRAVHAEFSRTVAQAKASPWPQPSTLFDNTY
jgi:TPP-dependent pyruvate/acetoin dehydrogenase alpha subunit